MPELTHEITVDAPPVEPFTLVANVTAAPQYFPTHLHAEVVRRESAERDLVERWVIDAGAVRGWRLWRTVDEARFTITFEHERPKPPLTSMRGSWSFTPAGTGGTLVRATHSFEVADADPTSVARIAENLDKNVPVQLKGIAKLVGRIGRLREQTVTSEHSAVVAGAPEKLYNLAVLGETNDERIWSRALLPDLRIVYKLREGLPAELYASTGQYRFREAGEGTEVTVRRAVTLTGEADGAAVAAAQAHLDHEVKRQLEGFAAA